MLVDIPPFFINPLDDQVLKTGKLLCYSDRARLHITADFKIKNGWLHPQRSRVLPAGYYSLFDQNDLRLWDFENYCQTNQTQLMREIESAKEQIELKKNIPAISERTGNDWVPYRLIIEGLLNINSPLPDYSDPKPFTEVRGEGKNSLNPLDNGWHFRINDENKNFDSGSYVNINRALIWAARNEQKSWLVGELRPPVSIILPIIYLHLKAGVSYVFNNGVEIWLRRLWYGQSLTQILEPDGELILKLLNPNANVPAMPGKKHDYVFMNPRSEGINYCAQMNGLSRQSDFPIPASFQNRHKFYKASDGMVYWGGRDFTGEE